MPKLQTETVVRSSADIFYDHFKTNMNNLPQYLPEIYKGVQVVEGDGINMGTVRHWKYVMGGNMLNVKEKVEDVDDENRSITLKVLGGDITHLYDSLRAKVHVIPLGENECSVQWTLDFVKVHEHVPAPNEYLTVASMVTREMAHQIH